MRKHFLLLFLMALLPLAGWAADGDIHEPTGKTGLKYTGAAQGLLEGAGSAEGTNYYLYYYVSTTESTPAWSTSTWTKTSANVKGTNAGTYYVYFAAYNENTQATPVIGNYISVTIGKCELTAAVKDATYFVKKFKEADPAKPVKTDVTITGMPTGVQASDVVDIANTINYSYTGENANADADGNFFTGSTGYAITFDGIALKSTAEANYTLTKAARAMKIKQIALTVASNYAATSEAYVAGKFKVTRASSYNPANPPLYNGAAQNLAYTVKYKYSTGATTTAEYTFQASDFVVKYKNSGTPYDDAIDALTYTPVISLKTNGNFSGGDLALATATATDYTIAQNNVFVILNTNSKTYDGYEFLNASSTEPDATFNFSGLKGRDAGKSVTGLSSADVEANTSVVLAESVGSYSMIVKQTSANNAEINYPAVYYADKDEYNAAHPSATVDDAGWAALTDLEKTKVAAYSRKLNVNYVVTPVAADWTINPKALTVTATAASAITYGQALPTFTITQTGALDGEADNVKAAYKATSVSKTEVHVGEDNVITVSRKTAEDYAAKWIEENAADADHPTSTELADAATAAETALEAADALLANYTPTVNNGAFTVNGVGMTIVPNIAATMEYGTTPTPTYSAFNNATYAPVTAGKQPVYLYRTSAEATYSETATTAPKEVGTYYVTIKNEAALAPTGYEPALIVCEETPFEITKKVLDFTIDDVTLHTGDTKTILNQYGKVTLKAGYSYVGEEKIDPEFNFVAVTGLTVGTEAQDFAITGDPGNYAGAIVASLPEGVANNDNYVLKAGVTGKLIIAAGRKLYIAGNDVYVNNKISDAAIACAANENMVYDVTFAPRTLVANDWNVVVLPFDITPYEFTEAIKGYAIFNTLKSANTANNTVKFGLELANLPANEPFLVKPLNKVDFEWDSDDNPETYTPAFTTFDDRVVKYAKTPAKTDVAGVKFVGTYLTKHVLVAGTDVDADFGYVNDGGEAGSKISFLYKDGTKNAAWYSATNTAGTQSYNWLNLESTKAYLDFNESSLSRPTIIVEEADGSTTAISAITNEGVAVQAEGWYTIDGMKLNAAPTQKGVYINNGKKVVVK